jgi:hypothetical protein
MPQNSCITGLTGGCKTTAQELRCFAALEPQRSVAIAMKRLLIVSVLVLAFVWVSACVTVHQGSSEMIELETAKELIASGQVKEIFQTHSARVMLSTRDGRVSIFDEPYLDWVIHYVSDNGLGSKVDAVATDKR